MPTPTSRETVIRDETPEQFLQQAAYHGGAARILIKMLQQIPASNEPFFNIVRLGDDVKRFSQSGFRWAAAYLDAVENPNV